MAAIEVITSQEREVKVKRCDANGKVVTTTVLVRIWNETVSNLTLMALGEAAFGKTGKIDFLLPFYIICKYINYSLSSRLFRAGNPPVHNRNLRQRLWGRWPRARHDCRFGCLQPVHHHRHLHCGTLLFVLIALIPLLTAWILTSDHSERREATHRAERRVLGDADLVNVCLHLALPHSLRDFAERCRGVCVRVCVHVCFLCFTSFSKSKFPFRLISWHSILNNSSDRRINGSTGYNAQGALDDFLLKEAKPVE